MILNYLQVALRNLNKNKSYVIINILGLGVAMACCITAYLLLAYNIEFDSFHKDKKVGRIYKIHGHFKAKNGGEDYHTITAPMPMAPIIAREISGIDRYARIISGGGVMRYEDKAFAEGISYADSTLFDMFDFPLVRGSYKSFKNKHSVYISEKIATKYFGKEDPTGKLVVFNHPNNVQIEAIVGGVVAKFPLNNTFYFDVLMRIENFTDTNKLEVDNWSDWRSPTVFVELASNQNVATVEKQFTKYVALRNEKKKDQIMASMTLEPFKAKFTNDDIQDRHVNLRMGAVTLVVFVSLAFLILLIACFNLTNTSIAMTSKRLKEVGVRKAIGAARSQIVYQFLFETLLIIVLSLVVGFAMSQIIVPAFIEMWNLDYTMADLNSVNLIVALLIIVFVAALLAGVYPALFNSKFNPVALLKGTVRVNGTNVLTRTLVSLQFALSVIVLVAGIIFIQNTRYQEKIKFGYDKEMVMTLDIQNEKEYLAMENELRKNPKVLNVAVSDHQVGYNNYQSPVLVDTTEYNSWHMGIGKNYFEVMGFKFVEGRTFNVDNASDQSESVIVNKAFLEKVNMTDPLDKVITIHGNKRHIVGVVENHIDNLYRSKEPEPFVYIPSLPADYKMVLIRAEPDDLLGIQKSMEKTWKQLFPEKPFVSRLQEDIVMKETKSVNTNLEKIFLFLTILGGLLSASGIFSLASLNIARRTKEIGIRKALGATVSNVVLLINREFVIILSIAGALGSVGGFYLTRMLLTEIYAYHIPVSLGPVLAGALIIFTIGILTTTSAIFKAARANPVKSLRAD